MDNDETLAYTREGDKLTVNFTAFPYGTHYCVRVAKGRIVSEHESHPDAFRDETEGLHESSGTSL
jgi:hypothetical protein